MSKKDTRSNPSGTYYRKKGKKYGFILGLILVAGAAFAVCMQLNQKSTREIVVNKVLLDSQTSNVSEIAKNNEVTLSLEAEQASQPLVTDQTQSLEESTNEEDIINSQNESKLLEMNYIAQMDELPSGCEITSLTMVLNYYGFSVDKCTLADKYLPLGPIKQVSLDEYFMGNPHDSSGYGCNSAVIAKTARNYIKDQGKTQNTDQYQVSDVTGTSFENLFSYIDKGQPVIIWATENMGPAGEKVTWDVNGKECFWIRGEHCLVLIGYDHTNHTVKIADPLRSIVDYNIGDVEMAYNQLGKQAVIISE